MNVPTNHDQFNELVSEGLKTSSKVIAEKFGKRHDNVQRDIRNIIKENPEWGVLNFEETPYSDPQNGQAYHMYEMTRDGYSMLVMGFTGKKAMEWKIKFLEAFNAMEQRLRADSTPAVLSGPQLMAAALIEADATIKKQTLEMEGMRADVEAHTRLVKAEGSLAITEAAKNLAMRPKDLFQWLSESGWIYKRPGTAYWLGYQDKCNRGYLSHKTTTVMRGDGTEKITEQVRITAKGMDRLARIVPGADQGELV